MSRAKIDKQIEGHFRDLAQRQNRYGIAGVQMMEEIDRLSKELAIIKAYLRRYRYRIKGANQDHIDEILGE